MQKVNDLILFYENPLFYWFSETMGFRKTKDFTAQ